MKKERIITLGNASSGKSNYMGLSLGYICRYRKDLPILGENSSFIDNINQSEKVMQSGRWLDKTQNRTELHFKAKLPIWSWFPFLTSEHEFVVDDWMGEAFEALGNLDKWESDYGLNPDLKDPFLKAIAEAENYVVFLDGEKWKEQDVENNVQESLRKLQQLLQDSQLSLADRRFAIVVTKADVLENLPEFAHESGDGLDIAKLQQHVTSKYPSFFNFLDWYKLSYRVFAVSCVPVKEHLRVDPEKGVVPASDWSMKDLESLLVHVDDSFLRQEATRRRHDQLAPFRWLFRY